jgi:hypothetical protein
VHIFNDDPEYDDNGIINVSIDKTDFQKSLVVEKLLRDYFETFAKDLMDDCGLSRNAAKSPMFVKALVGNLDLDFKSTFMSALGLW